MSGKEPINEIKVLADQINKLSPIQRDIICQYLNELILADQIEKVNNN